MIQEHRTTITVLTECLRDSAAATTRACRALAALDPEGCTDSGLYAMIPDIEEKFKAVKAGAANVKTLRDTIEVVRAKIEQLERSGQGELPLAPDLGPCTNCSTAMAACRELISAESACCDTCIHPEAAPAEPTTEAPASDSTDCTGCKTAKADCDDGFMASESLCCEKCDHRLRHTLTAAPALAAVE